MSKEIFDFTEVKEFELKTPAGDTVLREPTPAEYFDYLKKITKEGQEIAVTYDLYIEYFKNLGGDEKVLRSLTLEQIFKVATSISGGDAEKK